MNSDKYYGEKYRAEWMRCCFRESFEERINDGLQFKILWSYRTHWEGDTWACTWGMNHRDMHIPLLSSRRIVTVQVWDFLLSLKNKVNIARIVIKWRKAGEERSISNTEQSLGEPWKLLCDELHCWRYWIEEVDYLS